MRSGGPWEDDGFSEKRKTNNPGNTLMLSGLSLPCSRLMERKVAVEPGSLAHLAVNQKLH